MIGATNLTVLKVLALAGGGTRPASLNSSKILRQTPTGIQEIPVQLQKVLRAKSPHIAMVKGDILFVPGSAAKAVAYRSPQAAPSLTPGLVAIAFLPRAASLPHPFRFHIAANPSL